MNKEPSAIDSLKELFFSPFKKEVPASQENKQPYDDVLSPEYQRRAYKAIHDAESLEMTERKASAAEEKSGNTSAAIKHLRVAKAVAGGRIKADVELARETLVAITMGIRDILPDPTEFPFPVFDESFVSSFDSDDEDVPISQEELLELKQNVKAMEEREKLPTYEPYHSESEQMMEEE